MTAIGVTAMSVALTAAVISNAYYQKKQFYPSVVYITKSNPSMAVIYIQAFILLILIGKLMRKIFFGQLRAAEFEHLVERSWYAITETCLAFTVFRDDFSPKFVALFTVLLFLKSFHWLAEDRVDFMERSPIIGWLFHVRVVGLLSLLGALDLHFLSLAYYSTVTKGASVQLVFGFEFAILLTMAANTTIKYCLHAADLRSETPWDGKAVLLLYCELAIGFLKVLLYVAFIVIFVRIYTLPLFAFRPMYYTMRNFKKAFNDVILSRRAIRNMNTLYPDATLQELTDVDNVCIICREEMTANAKKLPCNHIFHTACLRSWFQRQQTCPTCRLDILRPTPVAAQNNAGAAAAARMAAAAGAANAAPQPGTNAGVTPGADNQIPTVSPPGFMTNHPFQHMMPPGGVGFPPFPFPMVGLVPPPVAPVNLAQLTDDELREMEGNERRHLEARIKCLRNVQLMLDASVALMQNYQMVVSRCPPPAPAQPQQAQTAQPESQTTETATAGPSASSSVIQNEIKSETTQNEPKPSTSKSQIQEVSPQSLDKSKDTSDTLSTNANGGILTETDELRRRRLRRFETQMTE